MFFCNDKVYLPIVNKKIQALFSIERKLLHKHIRNMISKQMEKVTANVGKRKCDKIYSTNLIKTLVFCYQNCSAHSLYSIWNQNVTTSKSKIKEVWGLWSSQIGVWHTSISRIFWNLFELQFKVSISAKLSWALRFDMFFNLKLQVHIKILRNF